MIKEAGADDYVIQMRSLEALEKVADGKSTKLIIPSNLQGMAGIITSAAEIVESRNSTSEKN